MRKLNIAFISSGTFAHIIPYLSFFKSRGHIVHWITYTKPNANYGVIVHDVSSNVNPSGKRIKKWKYILSVPKVKKILRNIKPDILHGHYATSAGFICRLSGFEPYIITVHGSDLMGSIKSFVGRSLLRFALKRAAMVNTVSQQLAYYLEKIGIPENKIRIFTFGIDTKLFHFKKKQSTILPISVLCTRTLAEIYDPFTIINACEILKKKNIPFKLTFAAGGKLEQKINKIINEKSLQNHIFLLGGYDNNKLQDIFLNHHIYISASHRDGTSISLLEAMACGVFPIVTRIESNKYWLEDGKTALMFERGNAQELSNKIIITIDNDELIKKAIQINRKLVEEKADREKKEG